MEAKSSVVKSKSSNSAKTTRSEHRNKKSRSSADFPPYGPYVMKKRGVYVEPRRLRINELEKNQVQERPKAPPRPKPGNKKFLASVLTILSKSTTGTQHPDVIQTPPKKIERKVKKKPMIPEKLEIKEIRYNKTVKTDLENERVKAKKKPKFKSKALNDGVDEEVNQLLVLQNKKDLVHTPSIYSENDSFNWSNLPSLVKRAQNAQQSKEAVVKTGGIASELTKEIMEGQKYRKDKRVRIDEPTTLVADTMQHKLEDSVGKANGKLYNFFVDLLETTISVYNVKQEYDKSLTAPSETSSTKIPLVINESVANKLNEPCESPDKSEVSPPPSHFCCLKDLEYNTRPDHEPINEYKMPLQPPKRKKYKSESFSFMRRPAPKKKITSESFTEKKKSFSKKDRKKDLLNMFKEQLKMDEDAFEEPQNLYQALKVIAQNKRRCQRTIHFEESSRRRYKDYGFPECMFKRRKVISPSTKGSKKNYKAPSTSGRLSELSGNRPKSGYTTDVEEQVSYQSLQVYGYDYETPAMRRMEMARNVKNRNLLFTYHSTPTHSDQSMDSQGLLDFSETDSAYFF